ncbi:MAG: hypothetical protein DRR06_04445 [Gammaproteobacteria bacterium]|nr:MAG: hypothetical protein DRR06_04445 [Gammaproteobacteria bacterium]RLA53753.1 MAG: hypothetical protein DRR42_03920 [Gammaproteobacteria bacterium]
MRIQTQLSSLLLASLLAMTGCGTQQIEQTSTMDSQPVGARHSSPHLQTDDDSVNANNTDLNNADPADPPVDYPVRPFPTQTFYQLLVAEFAGMRGDVQLAVDKYIEQAQITRDPNVIERAVRTASFARKTAALQELSDLWIEVDPESIEARKLAFYYLTRDGDVENAFKYAKLILQQGDGEPLVVLPGFARKISFDRRKLLLGEYTLLERTYPDNRNILLGKMQLESQQNDIKQALKTGKKLLQLEPDNESARLAIAQMLYQHGEHKSAIAILDQGIDRNPQSKKLHLQLIRFVAETDLAEAQRKMTQLVADHPDDVDLQFTFALLNKQLGLRDEASQTFHEMITLNRRVADAHYQLAIMAEEDGHTAEAISHYTLVGEGRNLLPATARLTQLMSDSGQITEARLYLHRLRLEHPELVVPFYRMESELLVEVERYHSAYTLLSESLVEYPENFDLLYTRSLVSEKLNDIASMEQDLRTILNQDADNVSALNALGYSLANHTDRYDEALVLVSQALAIKPDDPAIIDSMGWVLYRLGNNEEALVRLREAFNTMPDPEVATHLGEVLWISGEKDEAMSVWRNALELDPNSEYLLDTLNRFEVEL